MKAGLYASIGVKRLDEKGRVLGTASSTMIPIPNPDDCAAAASAVEFALPQLCEQASGPIRDFDPSFKTSTAEMLEAMARRLRAEANGNPQVFVRTDENYEEIRVLIARK